MCLFKEVNLESDWGVRNGMRNVEITVLSGDIFNFVYEQ